LKTQRGSCHPKCARKVSGLSRNGPLARCAGQGSGIINFAGVGSKRMKTGVSHDHEQNENNSDNNKQQQLQRQKCALGVQRDQVQATLLKTSTKSSTDTSSGTFLAK